MEEDIITADPTPVYTEPKPKRNRPVIIILLILLVLCCCCTAAAIIGWGGWTFGDQFVEDYLSITNSVFLIT